MKENNKNRMNKYLIKISKHKNAWSIKTKKKKNNKFNYC